MLETIQQNAALFYREGRSDKVYKVRIVSTNGGFIVNYQYGRPGGTLQSGTNTRRHQPQRRVRGHVQRIEEMVGQIDGQFAFDGEVVGDVYWVLDLLELGGNDPRPRRMNERFDKLSMLLKDLPADRLCA